MKKMFGVLIVLAFVCSICFAQEAAKETPVAEKAAVAEKAPTVTKVGNTICPVSGQKVDGVDFYEYDGKWYGMCCPACGATFQKDPKKYSAIAEKEAAKKK
jgi:YHS domain-containing protein